LIQNQVIDLGGGLHAVIEEIEVKAVPRQKVGRIRARLPATP
jgi:hypothetical protein